MWLGRVANTQNVRRHALKILLGLMAREIKLDTSKSRHIARVLFNLSNHMESDLVDDRKLFFMNTIDNSFDLAERMIYGEIDKVQSQLVHFLQEYQEVSNAFVLTDIHLGVLGSHVARRLTAYSQNLKEYEHSMQTSGIRRTLYEWALSRYSFKVGKISGGGVEAVKYYHGRLEWCIIGIVIGLLRICVGIHIYYVSISV
jgi:hypothetical protein